MPPSYTVDVATGIIEVRAGGPTELSRLVAVYEEMLSDTRLAQGMVVLLDWSRVEGVATPEVVFECVRMASRLAERLGPLRIAAVVTRPASHGMANLASAFAETLQGISLRGFATRQAAEAWLAETEPRGSAPAG